MGKKSAYKEKKKIKKLDQEATEREEATEEVLGAKTGWEKTFDAVTDLIAILDTRYRIVRVNKAMADKLGVPPNKAVGLICYEHIHGTAEPPPFCPHSKLLAEGNHHTAEVHEARLGGDFSVSVSPLHDATGRLVGSVHVARDITKLKRAERVLEVTQEFLKITNRHTKMEPLLQEFVEKVKNFTACEAVGIRILDEAGNIPYQAYEGFSQRFYESENPLSIHSDRCMCIHVIKGRTDPKLPFYTKVGSFYMNGTTRFLASVSEEQKGRTRNVCNQLGYESVALLPIGLGDQILGLIHVADSQENKIPLKMVEVLEGAAQQLGAALKRVWAEEDLQKAHDQLERRVEERTSDLVIANQRLKNSEEKLRRLSSQLLSAQEEERKRIGREIHDTIGQSLNAIKFSVENFLQETEGEASARDTKSLSSVITVIQAAVEEIHRIERNLRPPMLDDLGLLTTISWYCKEFQKIYSGIRIKGHVAIEENDVPDHLKIVIFRILQEALNNISKHSRANLVHLTLKKADRRIEMTVSDNGVGFDLGETDRMHGSGKGFGLIGMRERTDLSEGLFHIETSEGTGTTIRASWEC